jgi:xanthine dehydrogenase small subunit
MSLWALWRSRAVPTPDRVDAVLAGNLCRCTGYGPIAAAARTLTPEIFTPDPLVAFEPEAAQRLRSWAAEPGLGYHRGAQSFHAPRSTDELASLLQAHPQATVVAGATDVGLWVTKQDRPLEMLVYVGAIPELQRIQVRDGAIEIGAGVTYSAAYATLARAFPGAHELLRRLGCVQVRNMGTIGGNIANGSPIGDMPPFLIAAGATLVLRQGYQRRLLPLEQFFLAYGRQDRRGAEFVERIIVPLPRPQTLFRLFKISKRRDQDISAVCAAFALHLDEARATVLEARIAFGGMAATPRRAEAAERALAGQPLASAAIEAAAAALAQDFTPITDMRASAEYRLKVAQNLLRKCLLEERGEPVRLQHAAEPADEELDEPALA